MTPFASSLFPELRRQDLHRVAAYDVGPGDYIALEFYVDLAHAQAHLDFANKLLAAAADVLGTYTRDASHAERVAWFVKKAQINDLLTPFRLHLNYHSVVIETFSYLV
jgi:hypothetical protein